MEKFIEKYGEKIASLFTNSFVEKKDLLGRKSIHNLRLAVKRARNLIHLIDSINQTESSKKLFEAIKEIYKFSGRLRDIQVQRDIVKRLKRESPKEVKLFLKWAKNQQKSLEAEFLDAFEAKETSALKVEINDFKEYVTLHSKGVTTEVCSKFIGRELDAIKMLTFSRVNDTELHIIRKHLKGLVYALQLLVRSGESTDYWSQQLKGMNVLQEELGVMNDLSNLCQNLKILNANQSLFPEIEWIIGVEKGKVRSQVLLKLISFHH